MEHFHAADVLRWDVDRVCGWLTLNKFNACISIFKENDINGEVLLDMNQSMLEEMAVPSTFFVPILEAIAAIDQGHRAEEEAEVGSDSGSETEQEASPARPSRELGSRSRKIISKSKDPLRIAAQRKAVGDLTASTVHSGFLMKSNNRAIRQWKRRYFVLTDDNCLYYFKSPKDISGIGLIFVPCYIVDKDDNASKPYAFKLHDNIVPETSIVLASESAEETKVWMNLLSLASIAFGSGTASRNKTRDNLPVVLSEGTAADLESMATISAECAGGVSGESSGLPSITSETLMPDFLKKTNTGKKIGHGLTLCLVKMLDGSTLQLYASQTTLAMSFLEDVCLILEAYENYYFGFQFINIKGDEDWLDLEKLLLKHEFRKDDHIELEFRVRFYPIDVTQVIQYVTLYQIFLASMESIRQCELDLSDKDVVLLGALALQATLGDYDAEIHTSRYLIDKNLLPVPTLNLLDLAMRGDVKDPKDVWADEIRHVWLSLQGILRHIAVLKFMQAIQKHRLFASRAYDVTNKLGTPLSLRVSPRGLAAYRRDDTSSPIANFSWSECAKLSFTDKKFTIAFHDKQIKSFSVYTSRTRIAYHILALCMGLHRLYLLTVRNWSTAPSDIAILRQRAIEAAWKERETLRKESSLAKDRAAARAQERDQDHVSQDSTNTYDELALIDIETKVLDDQLDVSSFSGFDLHDRIALVTGYVSSSAASKEEEDEID